MRIDQYLYEKGHVQSRTQGQAMVMAGAVYINGQKAEKPGSPVPQGAQVELRARPLAYVSRGGLKLEKALQVFGLSPSGMICMDVGASTGGFTDCMLQNGASCVYAVDVGYGQLAWGLRNNSRVVVMERCNIRNLSPEDIPKLVGFFTVDVSFISLKLVLPALKTLTQNMAQGICLVKPQFEAGRADVGKHGVVREAKIHMACIKNCIEYANSNGFYCLNIAYSPIKGPKGNIEFLLHLCKAPLTQAMAHEGAWQENICDTFIEDVVLQAHNNL